MGCFLFLMNQREDKETELTILQSYGQKETKTLLSLKNSLAENPSVFFFFYECKIREKIGFFRVFPLILNHCFYKILS